jgi:hypothetical protein
MIKYAKESCPRCAFEDECGDAGGLLLTDQTKPCNVFWPKVVDLGNGRRGYPCEALEELCARAKQALEYLEHSDVQAIGFVVPARIMAKRLRTAIEHNGGEV